MSDKSRLTSEQLSDEMLSRAYMLALIHNMRDGMILHYEGTIGLWRVHVAIDIKDVRRDDNG